jgi:hypothetical protein
MVKMHELVEEEHSGNVNQLLKYVLVFTAAANNSRMILYSRPIKPG